MDTIANFGESLKDLLESKKVSVKTLAKAIGVSLPTTYDWLSNKQDIKLSNLNCIANYFSLSLEFVIGRSDNVSFVAEKCLPPFGKRLRQVMLKNNISTYTMRQKGYGSKHFQNWDNGADPFLSTLIELSKILDCSIDYLVGRET